MYRTLPESTTFDPRNEPDAIVRPGRAPAPVADVTVVVLTFNEARHIARCIDSVRDAVARVVVIDSHSTDDTVAIARRHGAQVLVNDWTDHATQLNWAIDHAGITTAWVFRLDADEIASPELRTMLRDRLERTSLMVAGLTVRRRIHFLGRWVRHGGIYPIAVLRLWRNGRGRCEQRLMDEHVVVDGEIEALAADIADDNLNNIGWWTRKHEQYATREAVEVLRARAATPAAHAMRMDRQARAKRWVKEHVYARLPLGLRAVMYFAWRYVVRLGVLDGWQGFLFHLLQGLWYRTLVDAKVHELQHLMDTEGLSLEAVVQREYGLRL